MIDPVHPALAGWENFYVIVGSSAAALIGLQFVVIALVKDTRMRTSSGSISAFGTPTVVHLGGALLVSALMSAPWPTLLAVSLALAVCGLVGLGYSATVIAHARRQTAYAPVWQDWLWHMILPGCAYLALTLAAVLLRPSPRVPLFVIAAAALGLLLIAIHNAWDTVIYIVVSEGAGEGEPAAKDPV
ncbi:MAG: hypothetical protein ACHQWU_02020 [Gemmatimonadales bacterium]|jgi:hypothetical protein